MAWLLIPALPRVLLSKTFRPVGQKPFPLNISIISDILFGWPAEVEWTLEVAPTELYCMALSSIYPFHLTCMVTWTLEVAPTELYCMALSSIYLFQLTCMVTWTLEVAPTELYCMALSSIYLFHMANWFLSKSILFKNHIILKANSSFFK